MAPNEDQQQRLWQLIKKGPLNEVYQGEEAWALVETISTHLKAIKESHYDPLCGRLQLILADHLTLAVTRVFESHDRYDTRGVPDILDLVDEYADGMEIVQPRHLRRGLAKWDSPPAVEHGCDSTVNRNVVRFLRSQLPEASRIEDSTHSMALWKATMRRNKRIAHNEIYELGPEEKATWYELVRLIRLARDIVAPISTGVWRRRGHLGTGPIRDAERRRSKCSSILRPSPEGRRDRRQKNRSGGTLMWTAARNEDPYDPPLTPFRTLGAWRRHA